MMMEKSFAQPVIIPMKKVSFLLREQEQKVPAKYTGTVFQKTYALNAIKCREDESIRREEL
jgi:hypothetical protein